MVELILTRGLPASGKTTWAREWVAKVDGRARVNRDDLRKSLFGGEGVLPSQYETQITVAQQAIVRAFLRKGISVVVDDTNLNAKYAKEWVRIAVQCGAALTVNDDFLEVPVSECIRRDYERAKSIEKGRFVGEKGIQSFHDRYPLKSLPNLSTEAYDFTVYVPDESLPKAWICDLDGTLALKGDRDIYDAANAHLDSVNDPVADLLWAISMDPIGYSSGPAQIIYLSGRREEYRQVTQDWLNENGLPDGPLYMREQEDGRDDSIVKHEILMRDIAPKYHVIGAFDDRDRVVDAWRRIGLFCAQVNYGDF